jgi:hypothetical protein
VDFGKGLDNLRAKFLVSFLEIPPKIGKSSEFVYKFLLLRRVGPNEFLPLITVIDRRQIST